MILQSFLITLSFILLCAVNSLAAARGSRGVGNSLLAGNVSHFSDRGGLYCQGLKGAFLLATPQRMATAVFIDVRDPMPTPTFGSRADHFTSYSKFNHFSPEDGMGTFAINPPYAESTIHARGSERTDLEIVIEGLQEDGTLSSVESAASLVIRDNVGRALIRGNFNCVALDDSQFSEARRVGQFIYRFGH